MSNRLLQILVDWSISAEICQIQNENSIFIGQRWNNLPKSLNNDVKSSSLRKILNLCSSDMTLVDLVIHLLPPIACILPKLVVWSSWRKSLNSSNSRNLQHFAVCWFFHILWQIFLLLNDFVSVNFTKSTDLKTFDYISKIFFPICHQLISKSYFCWLNIKPQKYCIWLYFSGNVVFGRKKLGRIKLGRIKLGRKLNGPNGWLGRKMQAGRKIFWRNFNIWWRFLVKIYISNIK
jgi:hypothetical protein